MRLDQGQLKGPIMHTPSVTPSIPSEPAPDDFAVAVVEHHRVPLWASLTITVLVAVLAALAVTFVIVTNW